MRILNSSEASLGTCSELSTNLSSLAPTTISPIFSSEYPNSRITRDSTLLPGKFATFQSFSLGIFLVVRIVICFPVNFSDGMCQVDCTTWTSVECVVAAFVANISIFNTLRRKTKIKPHLSARKDIMLR
jgi:hypothetical protein